MATETVIRESEQFTLDELTIQKLKSSMRGTVIQQGDSSDEEERKVYNIPASWEKEYWEALHPFSAGGAYVNFMMEEGPERVKASFSGNFEKLARIKKTYDPWNIFSVNQNITLSKFTSH